MMADYLTKPLLGTKFRWFRDKVLNIQPNEWWLDRLLGRSIHRSVLRGRIHGTEWQVIIAYWEYPNG
jgi:hypothetical protein